MGIIPYDDRDGSIWMDGRLIPWRDAKMHFLTHGLHYGGAVFEGLRCYDGQIFKLREHAQRMLDGCKTLDMKITYSLADIERGCIEAIKANNITDGYVRPLAWRGAEQMGVPAHDCFIHYAVAAWEWPNYFAKGGGQDAGISLVTSSWRRPPPNCAPVQTKAGGLYIICTMSRHEAEAKGYTDALMLDYRGQVAELTAANFFMVKNGEIHTPIPDCFLNGITRQTIIALAKSKGYKVIERVIMPEEIIDADECFATGTAAEVTAIGKINDVVYNVGPVTKFLREEYQKLVRLPSNQVAA